MKHVAIMACVLAASVMPTATAQTQESANSKAYNIRIQGEVVPMSLQDVAYPTRAAYRSRDGYCDLLVQSGPNGEIGGVAVKSCSDRAFRQEADRIAKQSQMLEGPSEFKSLRIVWTID